MSLEAWGDEGNVFYEDEYEWECPSCGKFSFCEYDDTFFECDSCGCHFERDEVEVFAV